MNANNKKLIKSVLCCEALEAAEFSALVKLSVSDNLTAKQTLIIDDQQELVVLLSGELHVEQGNSSLSLSGPVTVNGLNPAGNNCTVTATDNAAVLRLNRAELSRWLDSSERTAAVAARLMRLDRERNSAVAVASELQQLSAASTRLEKDLLGERQVPDSAYYGVQTLRAEENFAITGIKLMHFPMLVNALAMVKKAAAKANAKLGLLEAPIADAICQACDEIIAGKLHEHFVVDVIQGGAGTSTNMNANEVIANRGLEILGHKRGEYQYLHPNNHVNLSQSTNDAYPTAIRLGILSKPSGICVSAEPICPIS